MPDLNQYEIEVLEMMDGQRKGQWGAWVGACLGELAARGYCTRGPNYQITPKGCAFLDVRKAMQGAADA